jgi:NDP-sugar pyrophosphorylase family protein
LASGTNIEAGLIPLPDGLLIFALNQIEMRPTLLILAAGMGSRYGSLKQIEAVGPSGEAIIDYSIFDAIRAGFDKVTFIIRRDIEKEFREVFDAKLKGRIETEYVFQELDMVPEGTRYSPERAKPWGTAHAVWVARDRVKGPFVVINADDFYGTNSYRAMGDYLTGKDTAGNSRFCMMGYQLQHTLSDFGSVSRGVCESGDTKFLDSVVERTEIAKEGDEIYFVDVDRRRVPLRGDVLVSMNIWGFTPEIFKYLDQTFSDFIRANANQLKAEFYIPTVINELIAQGKASVRILPARDQWFGITYREDKLMAIANINNLISQGIYPGNLWH